MRDEATFDLGLFAFVPKMRRQAPTHEVDNGQSHLSHDVAEWLRAIYT